MKQITKFLIIGALTFVMLTASSEVLGVRHLQGT